MSDTILDLDALLDQTLDAVPDMPDFVTPPTGTYKLSIAEAEIKAGKKAEKAGEKDKAARIVVTYKVEQTVEAEGLPVPDGSLFTEGFQGTEQGLGYFKKQAKKLLNVEDLSGVSIRDILGSLKEMGVFDAVVKVVNTKGDNGKEYENVNIRPVHAA